MIESNDISIDNIKKQLYETYLDIKEGLTKLQLDKLNNVNNQKINSSTQIPILLKYIKYYINLSLQEKKNNINKHNKNEINNEMYKQLENYIIKLESQIRNFMKNQFQNKIQKDSLEMKIRAYIQIEEEYEELKEKVKYEDGKFLDNDRKENEIIILRRENSNLKKEINKLEEEKKDIKELEYKNKELEKKNNDDEEIIKALKYKINQLNNKITEIEEELNNNKNDITSNEINSKIKNINHLNLVNINDNNSRNKIDFNMNGRKISLEKFSLNNKNSLKHGTTNYKLPSHLFNYESTKNNHNYANKTIDTNKYIISTYNKISNNSHKNIIPPMKNDAYINIKKIKNKSVSNRLRPNDNSEIMNKYLSGSGTNSNNKYIKQMKSRSLNKIDKNISLYKLPYGNNSIIKKSFYRESRIPYENSAVNILGINKKN